MTMRWTFVVAAVAAFLAAPGRATAQGALEELDVHVASIDFDADEDAADQEPGDADEQDSAAEREQDEYDSGSDAIDEEEWTQAIGHFDSVIAMKGKRADAALYWKAYALTRAGRRPDALAAIAQLKASAPQSRWLDDAKALEIEIRQGSGQRPAVEAQSDEEMKLIAINSLMHGSPDEAVPMLEKFLAGSGSVKLKKKALFVLSQGGSPRAREVVTEIARGRRNPQLQSEALKYLGLFGGEQSRQALADIYASSSDIAVKKEILHSFMLSGDKARVIAAARGEKDASLRDAAVKTLGIMGAQDELWQLYKSETSVPVRKGILHAMFVGGAVDKLAEALRTERDPSLRAAAIHSLGLAGGPKSAEVLVAAYKSESDPEVKKKVLHALFLQGNASAMVQIARAETNPELRKSAVHWLSLMNSKEATAFMMEILNK
jgi:HEAT repeat protein